MTRLILSLTAVVILAQPLSAEIIEPFAWDGGGGLFDTETGEPCSGHSMLRLSQLDRAAVKNWLTYKTHVDDKDKDGFLEGVDRGVNPTGYVVFHFRTVWLNERITLGEGGAGLLDVPIMQSGGAAPPPVPGPIICGGSDLPGPAPVPPLPPPSPEPVPEPATVLLLATGMTVAILRRRR